MTQACHKNVTQTGYLNNRNLFLILLEGEEFKVKVPAWVGSGESPASLQMATFSLCPHMAEREEALVSLPPLIRALTPPWGIYSISSSKANHLPKAPPANTITLELRLLHMNLGDTTSRLLTLVLPKRFQVMAPYYRIYLSCLLG